MKTVLTKLVLCLALVVFCNLSQAATYYFSSSTGDDSRSASQAQNSSTPWKTIKKLNSFFGSLQPGDKVLFKSGETFYGSISVTESGSSGSPIVIGSYGSGPKPIITSLVTLNNWKSIGNGIFESSNASLGSEVNIVLLNNKIQELGRYPNSGAPNGGYLTITSSSGNSSVSSNELTSSPNFSGGEVVIRKNQWVVERHKISTHSGNRVNYHGTGTYSPSTGYGFFVQGHLKTLDQQGEWYYNGSGKKLNVHFGSNNPSSSVVQASSLDHLLTKSYGASHFRIENLHFKGANKDGIHLAGGSDIQIINTQVENAGENGITAMTVLELVVNNSKFSYSLNNGINLLYGNVGAKVTNNVVENTFAFQGGAQNGDRKGVGILVTEDNTLVEYNKILNTGFNGIDFSGNNINIKNNLIDGYCFYKNDGGGVYSFGGTNKSETFKNRKVTGNIIINGMGTRDGTPPMGFTSKAHASGIFLDDNANGVEISNNTIANNSYAGIKIANGSDISVKNNTFYNSFQQIMLGNSSRGRNTRNLTFSNNIYFSKYADQSSYTFITEQNDISMLGSFSGNYFARPMGDSHSISVRYVKANNRIDDVLDLERWQNSFGLDKNSSFTDQTIKAFEVKKLLGNNRYDNGSFLSNVVGMLCSDCETSWALDKLIKGAIKVVSPASSSLRTNIGSVKKDKNYILKFKASSNKKQGLRIYLRYSGTPWEVVSPSTTVELSDKQEEYTVLLKPYENVESTNIMFVSDEGNWTYWLDDVEFKEAEVEMTDPSDKILFEYNPTKSEKSISLNGTYVDAKNKTYSGSVTLAPYSSVVLTNTSGTNPQKPNEAPKVSITTPSNNLGIEKGGELVIKAEASAIGSKIEKVEFYSGSEILATSTNSPYSYVWKNVPEGTHSITAVAIDGNNLKATSQKVMVKATPKPVEGKPVGDKPADDKPIVDKPAENVGNDQEEDTNQNGDFAPLYVNTGSESQVNYQGANFVPIGSTNTIAENYTKSAHAAKSADALFQSSSFAKDLLYAIPVPNGTYTVKTYHSEGYFGESGPEAVKGQRVFDIIIEDQMKKKDFDLFVESGNKETVLTFENIEVKDGLLTIEMLASANNSVISGFAVIPSGKEQILPELDLNVEGALFIKAGSYSDITFKGNEYISEFKGGYFSDSDYDENVKSSSEPLYQSSRFASELNYAVPVPNGNYTVVTYHHEHYFGFNGGPSAGKGRRVFDIVMESQTVKKDFDLFAESDNKETALTFQNIQVKDGILNLDMTASANNAVISGIAIIPVAKDLAQLDGSNINLKNSLFINTGSVNKTVHKGNTFISEYVNKNFNNNSHIIENTSASSEPLFQTFRFGEKLNYTIPVKNGTYSVITYHNEGYFGKTVSQTGANQRVFDIYLEGEMVKGDLDLFKESSNKPIALQFDEVEVKDGILNLDLLASINNATISGIAIISDSDKALMESANLRIMAPQALEPEAEEENGSAHVSGAMFQLYPNPAKDNVTLQINKELGRFSILVHNMNGQLVDHHDPESLITDNGKYVIPVHHLQKGVYIITLAGEKEIAKQMRLLVAP